MHSNKLHKFGDKKNICELSRKKLNNNVIFIACILINYTFKLMIKKIQEICIINSNRTGMTSTCFELYLRNYRWPANLLSENLFC